MNFKSIGLFSLTLVLLSACVSAQGNWMTPVSIKDFFLMVNAIRTDPKKFIPRVKALFEDQRTVGGVHNLLGITYSDLQLTNFKSYLETSGPVQAVELDRGLTIVAWKQAKHMAAMNNLGNGIGPTGLNF